MNIKNLFRKKNIAVILKEHASEGEAISLSRTLTVKDLTFMGIAAIIGAGIFGTIGKAAANGGPGVSLLFIFTAFACLFSALCYAQFASKIPIAGSAYTYAYTAFGELIAWIIGWDLLMEYAIGNVTVAISWSDYFTSFLERIHLKIPEYFSMDYLSAYHAYEKHLSAIPKDQNKYIEGFFAWKNAPQIGNIKIILDLPALLINVFITALVYIGIKESKRANNILVLIKLLIIILVIGAGAFYIDSDNWSPFMPHGLSGIMKGVSAVFFAYIGFDAISTTAEESINPKRDLPKAMLYSLIICTVLYVIITFVLTGMEHYSNLNVGDPLDYVFNKRGKHLLAAIIAAGAIVAMTTVLLVFQIGQPRIWMSMSRDGLLPKVFSKIHPKYKTPSFSTIVTGIVVGLPIFIFNLDEVTDLTSIGTLFAFALVCGGILIQKNDTTKNEDNSFKIFYIDSRFIAPVLFLVAWIIAFNFIPNEIRSLFTYSNWDTFQHKIPILVFHLASLSLVLASIKHRLSLVPLLGLLTNLYLLSQLGIQSWLRFLIWLFIGLIIYFLYGNRKSKLNNILHTLPTQTNLSSK